MKKLIFISLVVIPFCKAADLYESWHKAIKAREDEIQKLIAAGQLTAEEANDPTTLSLDSREITAIPNDIKLPKLQELYLMDNKITNLPENLKDIFPQLRVLILNENEITSLDNIDLPRLLKLNLRENKITSLHHNFNLPLLEDLSLSYNDISYIDPQILDKFPKLRILYVSGNKRLTPANIELLKHKAGQTHPSLNIIADNIGKDDHDFHPTEVRESIELNLPSHIAGQTKLETVTIDLTQNETFTVDSFQDLIDEGTNNFVIAFTQADDKWHYNVFDSNSFAEYSKGKGDVIDDPLNRQLIKLILPITIEKEGDQLKYKFD